MLFPKVPDTRFDCPVDPHKIDQLLDYLDIANGATAFDAGCGKGEALIYLAERRSIKGLGVDIDAAVIDEAKQAAARRVPQAQLEFLTQSAGDVNLKKHSLDLAICLASTRAYDGYRETLRALYEPLKPGAKLLIGEVFWENPPNPEYLLLLNIQESNYYDLNSCLQIAVQESLTPFYTITASQQEWDHFQSLRAWKMEALAIQHPNDPDIQEQLKRRRLITEYQMRWGRKAMGFALHLLLKNQ